jgi:rhodanese-related sulfurtransferase
MMKRLNLLLGLLFLSSALMFQSCNNGLKRTEKVDVAVSPIADQAQAIVTLLEHHGDYVNAPGSPYLLAADDVFYNKNNYLLIDIRTKDDYVKGHIDGAYNVPRADLLKFLDTLDASQYEKIVICDNDGFESAYAASILRGKGYGNAFPLKYGMGAWNGIFATGWKNSGSNKYAGALVTTNTPKHKKGALPKINTKAKTVTGILNARAADVIDDDFLVSVDEVMNNKDNYYIINYWPKDKYESGHLPGAVWYAPKKSLRTDLELLTLPADKKIVVYCYTGLSASTVIGYLRLIGYDAYAIKWGANSFMYNTLKAKGWHAYNYAEKAGSFPLLKGEKRTEKKAVAVKASGNNAPAPKPVIKRKKKEAGGGGCD